MAQDLGAPHDDIVWLSTKEAAARLGLNDRTVYRLVDSGDLPAYRLGRVIRFQQAEVDAFIERSRIQPGTLQQLRDGDTDGPTD